MYGIIGSAVAVGAILLFLVRKIGLKDLDGNVIQAKLRTNLPVSTLLGGFIFGIGWAFTGACPGPLFVNLGAGYTVMIVPIVAAVFGSFAYGLLKKKLPH